MNPAGVSPPLGPLQSHPTLCQFQPAHSHFPRLLASVIWS